LSSVLVAAGDVFNRPQGENPHRSKHNIELSSRADSKPQARFHGKTAELTSVHSADCSNDLLDPDYS